MKKIKNFMTINIFDVYIKIYEYFSQKFNFEVVYHVWLSVVSTCSVAMAGQRFFFSWFKFLFSSFRVERGSKVARLLPPWV
jgi:hypothetical protein